MSWRQTEEKLWLRSDGCFVAKSTWVSTRPWYVGRGNENLRSKRGDLRKFGDAKAAMAAADKHWPQTSGISKEEGES